MRNRAIVQERSTQNNSEEEVGALGSGERGQQVGHGGVGGEGGGGVEEAFWGLSVSREWEGREVALLAFIEVGSSFAMVVSMVVFKWSSGCSWGFEMGVSMLSEAAALEMLLRGLRGIVFSSRRVIKLSLDFKFVEHSLPNSDMFTQSRIWKYASAGLGIQLSNLLV